jgi:hypothetical protein
MQPTQYALQPTCAICLMYINCPRVCLAGKSTINSFRTSVWDSHARKIIPCDLLDSQMFSRPILAKKARVGGIPCIFPYDRGIWHARRL